MSQTENNVPAWKQQSKQPVKVSEANLPSSNESGGSKEKDYPAYNPKLEKAGDKLVVKVQLLPNLVDGIDDNWVISRHYAARSRDWKFKFFPTNKFVKTKETWVFGNFERFGATSKDMRGVTHCPMYLAASGMFKNAYPEGKGKQGTEYPVNKGFEMNLNKVFSRGTVKLHSWVKVLKDTRKNESGEKAYEGITEIMKIHGGIKKQLKDLILGGVDFFNPVYAPVLKLTYEIEENGSKENTKCTLKLDGYEKVHYDGLEELTEEEEFKLNKYVESVNKYFEEVEEKKAEDESYEPNPEDKPVFPQDILEKHAPALYEAIEKEQGETSMVKLFSNPSTITEGMVEEAKNFSLNDALKFPFDEFRVEGGGDKPSTNVNQEETPQPHKTKASVAQQETDDLPF